MAKRKFDNWLSAYMEYSADKFVPDKFHKWAGLSAIAGAVERKVTLKSGHLQYVPNIFVMLVSHPKGGKSTAIVRAADIIEGLTDSNPHFRILPNQMTEPAFVDLMKIVDRVPIPGTTISIPQSAGYFYASEASSSALKDPDGFIVSAFTDFWDCPKWFRKKLKTERDSVEIENACLNLLAGTTFHFLRSLVNENSVMGGFASRLIYVVSPERKVREGKWENGHDDGKPELRKALIEDLSHINGLIGPMKAADSWVRKYEKWEPNFDRFLISLDSDRLEGIFARKDVNLIKVSMLLSIAESDSLVVEGHHFDQALELIEDAYKDNVSIVQAAILADKESQMGVNQAIISALEKSGGKAKMTALRLKVMKNGNNVDAVQRTIDYMISSGALRYDSAGGFIELCGVDSKGYL